MNNLKDYNIKALNFNNIMYNVIKEFLIYLEQYNIDCNYITKDIKNITLHFIIDNIIKEIDNFSCLLFFCDDFSEQVKDVPLEKEEFVNLVVFQLHKAGKKLNIPVIKVDKDFKMELEDIYNFRKILDGRKPPNVRKIKKFLKDNNLIFLEKKVASDRVLQKNLIK